MNQTTLPINEIIVENRQREDLGDIASLSESLQRYGLIQPIIVNQEKRLIAGGRRLAAATMAGWKDISVVYRETLSEEELYELELEENIRRKEMSWQERCKNIATIHNIRFRRNALEGKSWGQRETSELFGIALKNINYSLRLARLIASGDKEIASADSAKDAWDIVMRREQEAALAELARRSREGATIAQNSPAIESFLSANDSGAEPNQDASYREVGDQNVYELILSRVKESGFSSINENEAKTLFLHNPSNKEEDFSLWYKERLSRPDPWLCVNISSKLIHADCTKWMFQNPNSVDHIITDPPYGIEMANLSQTNTGIEDISTVAIEHNVEKNMELFIRLFPAAFVCLRDKGFFVLWCDVMQWNFLYELATTIGFTVQRWPITWIKTHSCINQMASINFTKTTEIAMVCRKGQATLKTHQSSCHILASNDEFKLLHPFAKPFDIWEFIINAVSLSKETILDPFAGCGSCIISGLRLDRQMLGIEINEAHYGKLLFNVKEHYLSLNPKFTFS